MDASISDFHTFRGKLQAYVAHLDKRRVFQASIKFDANVFNVLTAMHAELNSVSLKWLSRPPPHFLRGSLYTIVSACLSDINKPTITFADEYSI